jgi:hypothetical protein
MEKMKLSETMTEKQALRMACESYAPGELVSATKMYHDTLDILRAADYKKKFPLQGTISRRYRDIKDLVGMEYVKKLGLYRRKERIQLTPEEKRSGQQAMF